ncbi:hypothetical protein HDK77DRAFT_177610 [Phyllosticta capitalensis]
MPQQDQQERVLFGRPTDSGSTLSRALPDWSNATEKQQSDVQEKTKRAVPACMTHQCHAACIKKRVFFRLQQVRHVRYPGCQAHTNPRRSRPSLQGCKTSPCYKVQISLLLSPATLNDLPWGKTNAKASLPTAHASAQPFSPVSEASPARLDDDEREFSAPTSSPAFLGRPLLVKRSRKTMSGQKKNGAKFRRLYKGQRDSVCRSSCPALPSQRSTRSRQPARRPHRVRIRSRSSCQPAVHFTTTRLSITTSIHPAVRAAAAKCLSAAIFRLTMASPLRLRTPEQLSSV